MKLLSLGTVIKINDCKACIIGYSSTERESKTICGYILVSYPIGFTNIDKAIFIPFDAKFDILAEGYSTEVSNRMINLIFNGTDAVKDVSQEKLIRFNQKYKEFILSKREESKR